MGYSEEKSLWEEVNRRGSKLWTMMNDNSKAAKHRALFVQTNGGFFTQEGRYWSWTNPVKEHNGYWLMKAETGEKVFFENMTEFSKNNNLTPVKICELLNGKRKTYNGWTAVEVREVKDSVSRNKKLKEPKKKKIVPVKTVVFEDKVTGEVFTVSNLKEFSRNNNLDYGNVKNVASGRLKSYKNLKLHNPLEQYKDSSEPK
jgi:hypothetical protein